MYTKHNGYYNILDQIRLFMTIVAVLFFAGITLSCGTGKLTAPAPDAKFIAAHTGGIVSLYDPIKVVFNAPQGGDKPIAAKAFRLFPSAEGGVSWENDYTLVFTPSKALKPSTHYQALVTPASFTTSGGTPFAFEFGTSPAAFEVRFDPVRTDSPEGIRISGTIITEKGHSDSDIEKTLRYGELSKPEWVHEETVHRFTFSPVERGKQDRTVAVKWNGSSLGSKEKGEVSFPISALNRFEVLDIQQTDPNTLQVTFSSPLKKNQDMRGFISLSGNTNVRYSVEDNIAQIYGSDGIPENTVLSIQDLTDAYDEKLYTPVQYTVSGRWDLPETRFGNGGNILPTTQGTSLVVETRNLSGLIVEAFEIPGQNMTQFLQVNDLGGTQELYRVGEPVWVKALEFPWSESDKNRWVRRGLDLSELSRRYPDSMFRIRITFRHRHVKYECEAGHADFSTLEFPDDTLPPYPWDTGASEESNWDYYDNYSENSYDWYRYRRDPCHPAFYTPYSDHDITVGRNVLVSDLGLLVKRGVSGEWLAAATKLDTANPASGSELQLVNFQGRVLQSVKTGADGLASFKPEPAAAFLYGYDGKSRAYLKLNDSLALATSHFDLAGERVDDGVKGIIYGDRGVWRPGDTLLLTFLMEDKKNILPPDHPILFELEDPQGRIAESRTYTSSVNGFYAIPTATSETAPTGDWTARVRVGGKVFTKSLKIETVMPNRLKMTLDTGSSSKGYLDSSKTPMTLEAAWLHGAPAPNLSADVSVIFSDRETTFPGYSDYTFRDGSRTVSSERHMLYDGMLDSKSQGKFQVELSPGSNVPGKLYARFLTRVFEPSGAFSSEQISMDFSPYKRYVGLKLPKGDEARNMLLTDVDHPAEIVVVDSDGKPVQGKVQLECALYKMEWRWWWEKSGNEAADFTSALSRSPVIRDTIEVENGKGTWDFRVNYPSWGRYLVIIRDKNGGHAASQSLYIDWPGWAGRPQTGAQGAEFMLSLTADKSSYTAGETISVSFPSNKDARALVALEKGGDIIRQDWITCSGDTTNYRFTADGNMAPNIYVHITLLQPHLQTANNLPIRLYGIIPVSVTDPMTRLKPVITTPQQWEPASKASFTVAEANGRPMTYTVAVVDEGLLGLTRYRMPDPWNSFFRREASFLKSWDLFSSVIGAYSGKLETLLAIGGSEDVFDDSVKKTDRFKPVAMYFGPYELGAGESRTETFDMPQYVGAVRVMVVAASSPARDSDRVGRNQNKTTASVPAYGVAEQPVTVKSDLMVLGTLPRILSPDDEIVIPVSVFSYSEGKNTIRVNMNMSGNIELLPGTPTYLDVSFDSPGDKIVEFRAKAAGVPGQARVQISAASWITASSPGLKTALYETELEVRSTAIPVTVNTTRMIAANDNWSQEFALPGRIGTNSAVLELSRITPLGMDKRLEFLINYPHGCIEQTTSSVFPQLFLDKVMDLTGEEVSRIQRNITAAIGRISTFQTYNGGFSYWPGESGANDWGTSYAGHFLIMARRAGYHVPQDLLDKWTEFQKNSAASWSGSGSQATLNQAYRLYTMAIANKADLGSMNRLRERQNLPPAAAWRLAAAYWYAGQRDAARTMVRELSPDVTDYRELSGTFGSAFRDRAMMLETLSILGEDLRAKELYDNVSATLASDAWLSTQETAYALIAALPFIENTVNSNPVKVEYYLNRDKDSARTVSFSTSMISIPLEKLPGNTAELYIANGSTLPVYARVAFSGLPQEGSEPAISEGLGLSVEYLDMNGYAVDPTELAMGEDMEVKLTVSNKSSALVSEVAVVHILPASWELVNTRLSEASASSRSSSSQSQFKYQDIRDDRVMTYFNLARGENKVIRFVVTRAYGGSYFIPAIHAYAMYDESIRAVIPGTRTYSLK